MTATFLLIYDRPYKFLMQDLIKKFVSEQCLFLAVFSNMAHIVRIWL